MSRLYDELVSLVYKCAVIRAKRLGIQLVISTGLSIRIILGNHSRSSRYKLSTLELPKLVPGCYQGDVNNMKKKRLQYREKKRKLLKITK